MPLVNGITQCYLPPDRGDRPGFTPTGQVGVKAEAGVKVNTLYTVCCTHRFSKFVFYLTEMDFCDLSQCHVTLIFDLLIPQTDHFILLPLGPVCIKTGSFLFKIPRSQVW